MTRFIAEITILLCLTLLGTFSSCISEEEGEEQGTVELKVGDTLPDFKVTMNDGTTISTADLKGQCSIVVFFHTLCPDCQEEFPLLQRLYETRPYPFQMVCISRKEGEPSISRYWDEHQLTLPYSAQEDADVYHLFASTRIPRIYISDAEGRIRAIYTDDPIATYSDLLNDLQQIVQP